MSNKIIKMLEKKIMEIKFDCFKTGKEVETESEKFLLSAFHELVKIVHCFIECIEGNKCDVNFINDNCHNDRPIKPNPSSDGKDITVKPIKQLTPSNKLTPQGNNNNTSNNKGNTNITGTNGVPNNIPSNPSINSNSGSVNYNDTPDHSVVHGIGGNNTNTSNNGLNQTNENNSSSNYSKQVSSFQKGSIITSSSK